MIVKSYAKINLTLEIGKKLPSGYHEIKSIMQQINLYDILKFEKIKENKIIIKSNKKELENEDNLAYKAALLLKNKFNIKEGIEIYIKKNIPIGAGLGGGSGNAAVTLKALNKLWGLNLNNNKLIKIGRELGSDVPFHIVGKTALVEGTGEKIKKIKSLPKINIILINPGFKTSTKWAYEQFDKTNIKKINNKNKIKNMVKAIKNKNIKKIAENLFNDFEPIIIKKYPIIKKIKNDLIKNNVLNALMSGSGSSVFGVFENKNIAEKTYKNLKNKYSYIKSITTI